MKKEIGRYHILENYDKVIVDLNECIEIVSVESDFSHEILYMSSPKHHDILETKDLKMSNTHMILEIDEFNNQKLKVLDLEDSIKWVIKNRLDELFEKEFKKDLDLTKLKLIS